MRPAASCSPTRCRRTASGGCGQPSPCTPPRTAGVEYDVLGIGYHDVDEADRAAVLALHPRPGFKQRILQAFTDGMRTKPESTFGTVNADVLAHYTSGFERGDFVRTILDSPWPE
jgi:hypothetical protein